MLFRGELLPKVFNIVMGRIIGLVPTDIWLKLVVFINGTLMAAIHNKRSPFNKIGYQSRGFFSICTLFSNLCLSFVVVCVVVCIEEGRVMSFQFALYSQTYVSRSLLFCVVCIEEGRVMRAIVDTILQLFAPWEVLVPLFFGKKKKENNKNTNIRPSPVGETIWLFLLNPSPPARF